MNKQRSWPEPKDGEPRLHINEQPALTGNFPIIGIDLASGPDRTVEVSYVAPPGYVMVPMRLTAENGAKGALSGEFSETKFVNCSECFGDDECETCDGSGELKSRYLSPGQPSKKSGLKVLSISQPPCRR